MQTKTLYVHKDISPHRSTMQVNAEPHAKTHIHMTYTVTIKLGQVYTFDRVQYVNPLYFHALIFKTIYHTLYTNYLENTALGKCANICILLCVCVCAVSYTHLDVYKRQGV